MKFIQQRWRGLAIWAIIIGILLAILVPNTLQAWDLKQNGIVTTGQVLNSRGGESGGRYMGGSKAYVAYLYTDQAGNQYTAESNISPRAYDNLSRQLATNQDGFVEIRYLANNPAEHELVGERSDIQQTLIWWAGAIIAVMIGLLLWVVAWPNPKAGNEWEPQKP